LLFFSLSYGLFKKKINEAKIYSKGKGNYQINFKDNNIKLKVKKKLFLKYLNFMKIHIFFLVNKLFISMIKRAYLRIKFLS
jgi:hypothetical protein